jgi:hypothetical protein
MARFASPLSWGLVLADLLGLRPECGGKRPPAKAADHYHGQPLLHPDPEEKPWFKGQDPANGNPLFFATTQTCVGGIERIAKKTSGIRKRRTLDMSIPMGCYGTVPMA